MSIEHLSNYPNYQEAKSLSELCQVLGYRENEGVREAKKHFFDTMEQRKEIEQREGKEVMIKRCEEAKGRLQDTLMDTIVALEGEEYERARIATIIEEALVFRTIHMENRFWNTLNTVYPILEHLADKKERRELEDAIQRLADPEDVSTQATTETIRDEVKKYLA